MLSLPDIQLIREANHFIYIGKSLTSLSPFSIDGRSACLVVVGF